MNGTLRYRHDAPPLLPQSQMAEDALDKLPHVWLCSDPTVGESADELIRRGS